MNFLERSKDNHLSVKKKTKPLVSRLAISKLQRCRLDFFPVYFFYYLLAGFLRGFVNDNNRKPFPLASPLGLQFAPACIFIKKILQDFTKGQDDAGIFPLSTPAALLYAMVYGVQLIC